MALLHNVVRVGLTRNSRWYGLTFVCKHNWSTIMEKIVAKYAIYYNYPHRPIYHKNRKWGMALLKKKAEVFAFIKILPRPHLSMLGIWHCLLTTWLGSTLIWGNGVTFLLNQVKCVNFFFMIAALVALC